MKILHGSAATFGTVMLAVATLSPIHAASAATSAASPPSTASRTAHKPSAPTDDRIFYSLGVLLSQNLASFSLSEHEFLQVVKGFSDGFHLRTKLEDAQTLIPRIQDVERDRGELLMKRQKAAGAAYVAKVAALPGARKTPSGLVFINEKTGTGAAPKATDQVTVQYVGKLVDGTVFDSSLRRGQPATFPLGGIIPCWREGMQLMKVGGKARILCSSDLAYGDRGRPPVIPPGATLDFDVELLAVMPAPPPMQRAPGSLPPGFRMPPGAPARPVPPPSAQ